MNIEKARDLLIPERIQSLDCLPYQLVVDGLHVMARPRFMAVMNQLACCMNGDEVYMEVGCYQGGSLIGTLLDNNVKAVAVESFIWWPEKNTPAILEENLTKFGVRDRVTVHAMDYHEYFKKSGQPKIGLYYYDGDHVEEATLAGLEAAWPFISPDNGMIVLDDTFYQCVNWGINRFIGNHAHEVQIVCAVSPYHDYHPDWWNGTVFLQKVAK